MLKYKDLDLSIEDIADELGVDAILEGSVRTTGDEVRIQLYLVDTQNEEKQLWSKDSQQD